jgi:hypothetical protein
VSERSLELRGENGVITVTVRPFARSRVTFARRVKGVVLRILNRVAPDRTGRLQPAELPTQFIVLSHYLQARRGLPSDQALADAIGVPRAEVVLWTAGQVPGDEKMRRLRDLATIVARLAEYYEPAAIPDWLYGQNPDLGGRQPIELLHEGNLADVLSAAEAQISGAYI